MGRRNSKTVKRKQATRNNQNPWFSCSYRALEEGSNGVVNHCKWWKAYKYCGLWKEQFVALHAADESLCSAAPQEKGFLKSVLSVATFTFKYNMQKFIRKSAFSIGIKAKIIFMCRCYLQPKFKITATVIFQLANTRETADSSSRVIFFFIR